MLLSTLLTEEDDILQQYQEAIDCFKLVLEQSDGTYTCVLLTLIFELHVYQFHIRTQSQVG